MRLLVYFIAYYWDNHQGGSGKYVESKLLVEIENDVAAYMVLEKIHDEIKIHLGIARPFNQTVYSKNQAEYSITRVEIL